MIYLNEKDVTEWPCYALCIELPVYPTYTYRSLTEDEIIDIVNDPLDKRDLDWYFEVMDGINPWPKETIKHQPIISVSDDFDGVVTVAYGNNIPELIMYLTNTASHMFASMIEEEDWYIFKMLSENLHDDNAPLAFEAIVYNNRSDAALESIAEARHLLSPTICKLGKDFSDSVRSISSKIHEYNTLNKFKNRPASLYSSTTKTKYDMFCEGMLIDKAFHAVK